MEPQRSVTGAPLARRRASEGRNSLPADGAIPWSRPGVTRFGLERTLVIYGGGTAHSHPSTSQSPGPPGSGSGGSGGS
jgi:hypothetical protein